MRRWKGSRFSGSDGEEMAERRFKKKDLLEMIATLEEANDFIGKSRKLDESDMIETLAQCQEAALAMGNFLETYGESGQKIVELLENYCENIYQLSQTAGDDNKRGKTVKRIRKQLFTMKSVVRNELPEGKKEVVFLPYKASMWDSLESIWKRAAADENCEVYVVPIPYYDKNSDGSLGQMHYEGAQYPDDVPITSWHKYDMAARRPDVVFIHNPYDDCNYVTSIHPDFYAKELKEHADLLVYVPYFICINDVVREEFCVLPGTIWADRVILQSEAVRKSYIEIYHRWEDSQGCRDMFGKAEVKFLALGSPKFDKVISAKREDYVLPEEWRRLIEREDGSRRKVVLYNTTLGAMLQDTEGMLEKIRNVLEVFRSQKEVVLLWRPHPLFRETLQSMRRRLVEEYDEIVERYREEGWGIYDDTADMYRAITVSDAYYGDWSSVVELYKQTKKPIMIQNVMTITEE